MALVFNKGAYTIGTGAKTWNGTTVSVLLMKSSYTPDKDQNFISDISADEISVSGYSRQTAGSKTTTEDDANDRVVYDCADPVFTALAAGQTYGSVVFAFNSGSDATSELIAYCNGSATATNGGNVTVTIPSTGAFYLQE